jgi:hypothetical protein
MGHATFAELLEQLVAYRDRDYRTDLNREEARFRAIESVLQATLEKLRDMHAVPSENPEGADKKTDCGRMQAALERIAQDKTGDEPWAIAREALANPAQGEFERMRDALQNILSIGDLQGSNRPLEETKSWARKGLGLSKG